MSKLSVMLARSLKNLELVSKKYWFGFITFGSFATILIVTMTIFDVYPTEQMTRNTFLIGTKFMEDQNRKDRNNISTDVYPTEQSTGNKLLIKTNFMEDKNRKDGNNTSTGADLRNASVEISGIGCKKLPDVLIIGFEKCGTMTLRQFLSIHPRIFINKKRGNNKFFNRDNNKTLLEFSENLECTPYDKLRIEKLAIDGVADLVYNYTPDIKLIVIVREPVERSLSYFLHLKATQKLPRAFIDFEESLYSFLDKPFDEKHYLVQRYYYSKRLRPWIKKFGLDKILIVDGDQFATDPVPELKKVEQFLELEPFITRDMFEYNEIKRFYCVKTDGNDGCMYRGKGRPHPVMKNETRKFLKEAFREPNEQFFKLIQRRFSWND